MAVTVSLCMIVKNEETNLPRCLDCVKGFVDEINITDTGSADATVEIARQYTDRVFCFDWVHDFSAARNFSFSHAAMDYILWLDADDIIIPENQQKFIQLKKTLARNIDYILMPYHYSHDENGRVLSVQTRERMVKRSKNFTWHNAVHETIGISGNCLMSDIFITHMNTVTPSCENKSSLRNLLILEQEVEQGNPRWRTLFYYGTGLYQLKRNDEALKALERLFALENDCLTAGLDAYIAAHRIYLERKDYDNALKILLDNEKIFVDKSEYYCELASFYQNIRSQPDIAADYYTKALKCRGNDRPGVFIERNEEYYYFIPLCQLGLLLCGLGMFADALPYLEKALVYYPNHEKTVALVNRLQNRR
jgi:glycosyltransferase involved in cell wall biosynthesis